MTRPKPRTDRAGACPPPLRRSAQKQRSRRGRAPAGGFPSWTLSHRTERPAALRLWISPIGRPLAGAKRGPQQSMSQHRSARLDYLRLFKRLYSIGPVNEFNTNRDLVDADRVIGVGA